MHSPVTHAQLAIMALLIVQSLALYFVCPAVWRHTSRGRFGQGMAVLSRVLGVLCGASGGVVLWALIVYGLRP